MKDEASTSSKDTALDALKDYLTDMQDKASAVHALLSAAQALELDARFRDDRVDLVELSIKLAHEVYCGLDCVSLPEVRV